MIPQSQHLNVNPQDSGFYQNPYQTYAKFRPADLVYWEYYNMYCALSFDCVDKVLRDRRFARVLPADHPAKPAAYAQHLQDFSEVERWSLLNLEPPDHTRIRSLINHAFTSRNLAGIAPEIKRLARSRIDGFRNRNTVDLLSSYAAPVAGRVIAGMIGVDEKDVDQLIEWSHSMVKVYTLTQSRQDELRANQAAAEFREKLLPILNKRRHKPADDLLSHILQARVEGQALSDDEVISTLILLLNAGHEATVHQLGNGVLALLNSSVEPASLFATPTMTKQTITEILRYDPPLHLFIRYALEDLQLGEVCFKSGDQIGLLLGAANRDPARFNEPDRFLPTRENNAHLSLGAGIHYCVGAILARMELEITIPLLFESLPDLQLAETPRYQNAYHFHGLEQLMVTWR